MIEPVGPVRDDFQSSHIRDFGFGITDETRTQQPPGAALESVNCDYHSANIESRKGYEAILENGPGAIKIADFETGESWAGGSADVTNFVLHEAEADGAQGRSITAAGGGAEATSILTLGAPVDLGSDDLEVFNAWVMATALPAGVTSYTLKLRFETASSDYYECVIASNTDPNNVLELNDGKYHRFRRQDFTKTGSPTWASISKIHLRLLAGGSGNLIVTVDNLHRTPGLIQDLFEFRRSLSPYAGATGVYAVARGNLYRSDDTRWQLVYGGFASDRPVYSITTQDRRILSDGVTTPILLMPDGTTTYRLGIEAPPRQTIATQDVGGSLPDGEYFIQILYYSSKTGYFSAPDSINPDALVTISGGGNAASIRLSNIPVSSDPQVDWIVIGIRPEEEPTLFYRPTDGIYGDIPNGITTFQFPGPLTNLVGRTLSAVDPDQGAPTVVDPTTREPVLAHPLFMLEIGGYIVTVMSEEPSVVRFSAFRNPGAWAIDDESPVGEDDNEPVTGLAKVASQLAVFKRNAVHPGQVVGGDAKIVIEDSRSEYGSVDHKGILLIGGTLFYRGQDGVYRMGPEFAPAIVTGTQMHTFRALWDPAGYAQGAAVRIRDRRQFIHFGRSLGMMRNGTGWTSHYLGVPVAQNQNPIKIGTWAPSIWKLPCEVAAEIRNPTGWEPWIGGMGQVWRLNYGDRDDRRPIEAYHRSVLYSPDPKYTYRWRWLDYEAEASGIFTLDVEVYFGPVLNSDVVAKGTLQGTVGATFPITLGQSQLGEARYVQDRIRLPNRQLSRYLSFKVHFRGKAGFSIMRMTPWWAPAGPWRISA